jgi:hypothetical protein
VVCDGEALIAICGGGRLQGSKGVCYCGGREAYRRKVVIKCLEGG